MEFCQSHYCLWSWGRLSRYLHFSIFVMSLRTLALHCLVLLHTEAVVRNTVARYECWWLECVINGYVGIPEYDVHDAKNFPNMICNGIDCMFSRPVYFVSCSILFVHLVDVVALSPKSICVQCCRIAFVHFLRMAPVELCLLFGCSQSRLCR